MSAKKLKAPQPGTAMAAVTQLKDLWRFTWDDSARDSWRARLESAQFTQAQNRDHIRSTLGIHLSSDSQLNRFRKWIDAQDAMDEEAETQADEERRIREAHPDWTLDQVRDEVLKLSLYRAVATGEFKSLGLPAVDRLERIQARQFDMQKYADSLKSKVAAGLDEIAALFKRAPELLAEFNTLRAKLSQRLNE